MTQSTQLEPIRREAATPATEGSVGWALRLVRFDPRPAHRQPSTVRLVVATGVAIVLCILADWVIARITVAAAPGTSGYPHFQVADYAKLTIVGIIGAAISWPVVTRLCAAPRWLYLRLAVLVTAVLLLPDLYIYLQGQPGAAVIGLVAMHLAIGVITYNAIVRLAPVQRRSVPSY